MYVCMYVCIPSHLLCYAHEPVAKDAQINGIQIHSHRTTVPLLLRMYVCMYVCKIVSA